MDCSDCNEFYEFIGLKSPCYCCIIYNDFPEEKGEKKK